MRHRAASSVGRSDGRAACRFRPGPSWNRRSHLQRSRSHRANPRRPRGRARIVRQRTGAQPPGANATSARVERSPRRRLAPAPTERRAPLGAKENARPRRDRAPTGRPRSAQLPAGRRDVPRHLRRSRRRRRLPHRRSRRISLRCLLRRPPRRRPRRASRDWCRRRRPWSCRGTASFACSAKAAWARSSSPNA